MTFEAFYLGCFLVGFLLSFVSFLVQASDLNVHSHGDFHGGGGGHHGHLHLSHGHAHAHAGANGHQHQDNPAAAGIVAKFNFSTFTAFLAWFGGTGYLLTRYTSVWMLLALMLAVGTGLAGASVVFWFLAKLVQRDRTLDPADYDMVGVLGNVSSIVYAGGVGEIVFTQDGVRKCAPVRSEDGAEIEKGAEVVVTRYEKGVGYVRRWSDLAGMTAGL